jgi:isopenicillin-N N-acyltransferase-like protein
MPPEPLLLQGAPRDRGRAHGESLRALIHELMMAWEDDVAAETDLWLDDYLRAFRTETDFLSAAARWAPDLLEEVRGIAEGACLPFDTCFALQCMDEHWTHVEKLKEQKRPDTCSTLAVAAHGEHPTRLGQNMDLPPFLDGFQTLLRIEHEDHVALVPSYAGFLGLFGVNGAGLGVGVNALSQLGQSVRGLPVACVVRGVLTCSNVREAVTYLERVPHASAQHYLVADASEIVGLECSAGGVAHMSEATRLCHTNHPLVSADVSDAYRGWDRDRQKADEEHALTLTRLDRLEEGIASEDLGLEEMQALLAKVAHPIDGPYGTFTFCSAVIELGSEPMLHVAFGAQGPIAFPATALQRA